MSDDYKIALECNSDLIRVGSRIFNENSFNFIFFKTFNLFAIEVKCNFEEVYQNGETQQGIFLIKKDKLRYNTVTKIYFQ